ncbi:HEPN domain-containing protein [Pseudoroseicyclus aestuarii]|uniref:HEPN domain-containing protein n=1 Tax=Pseudoroseicyclus aestuarii TaxID=1795041 RepID=UPI000DA25226|nr:HEPN domain-containing protein [Pseudoroseicyclus aestuarii]
MSRYFDAYLENAQRVRSLIGFHDSMSANLTSAVDISDILRAAHVLSVSALDSFIHELVRAALMDIFDGKRADVPGYSRLRVNLGNFTGYTNISGSRNNVENDIRVQHGYLAFQHPDKIADAVRCVSEVKLWDEVGSILSEPAKQVKQHLILVVERRNKIAHEADIDPTFGVRWPIRSDDVLGVVECVDRISGAIDQIVDL